MRTKQDYKTFRLGDILQFVRNGLPIKQSKDEGGLPITRIETISKAEINPRKVGYAGLKKAQCIGWLLEEDDILFSHINSIEHLGKCAIYEGTPNELVHGMNLLCLRTKSEIVYPRFLLYYLRSPKFRAPLERIINPSVNQASVSISNLNEIKISLPSLPEQKRIVAVLDEADALRRKRREAIDKFDVLLQSVFAEMFGKNEEPVFPLSSCSEVVSGVTKGRNFGSRQTVCLPYIRVANVQDGFLDLNEIKTVEALPSDLNQLRLQVGDVLLTEGGDYDKLGRGAMWQGQIDDCIHQNHIFRVRTDRSMLLPEYFEAYLQTPGTKRYFLRCAKRTTNLASINMTQLKGLPVSVPNLQDQHLFTERRAQILASKKSAIAAEQKSMNLFRILQHQVFPSQLSVVTTTQPPTTSPCLTLDF